MSRKKAIDLYEKFTGKPAEFEDCIENFKIPDVCLKIGMLHSVIYEAEIDGEMSLYKHDFKRNRPILAVGADGKQLMIIGGNYKFTENGIKG